MATIPKVSQLQREIPSGQTQAVSLDTRAVGQGFLAAAEGLQQYVEKESKLEVAKARANFLMAKTQEDNAYDDDDDYGTFEDRYSKNMTEKLGEASKLISHPAARQAFMQEQKVNLVKGQERIRSLAFNKEKDFERASLNDTLEGLRETALTGDLTAAKETADFYLESAYERGFISAQESQKLMSTFQQSAAEGRISMLEPEEAIKTLNSPQAKYLPSDVRVKLKKQKEAELVDIRAMREVDRIMSDPNITRAQGQAKVAKLPEKIRRNAQIKFEHELAQRQAAELEEQSELFDQHFLSVRLGQVSSADIMSDLQKMTPQQQQSILNAEAASTKRTARTYSDPKVLDTLNVLKARATASESPNDWQEVRRYFMDHAAQLNATDYKDWSEISVEGQIPPEVESSLNDKEYLLQRQVEAEGMSARRDPQRQAQLQIRYDKWARAFQAQQGRGPSTDERERQVDRLLMEQASGWRKKPFYQIDPEEIEKAYVDLREDNPVVYEDVAQDFRDRGIVPTAEEFIEAFNLIQDARAAGYMEQIGD